VLVQARALNACAETEIDLAYYRGRSAKLFDIALFGIELAQSVIRLSVV
jgi:hypothetical protein